MEPSQSYDNTLETQDSNEQSQDHTTNTPLLSAEKTAKQEHNEEKWNDDDEDSKEEVQSDMATVKLKLIETNITKLKNPETSGFVMNEDRGYEMKDYKIEHSFKVNVADIPNSQTFKSNYLKSSNTVEIALSFNPLLPIPSFDCIRELLLQEVKKAQGQDQSKELSFHTMDSKKIFDFFIAACAIEKEELATYLFEQRLYKSITLENFIKAILTSLENSLKDLSLKLFKKFREYVLAYFDLIEPSDEIIARLKGKREDDWEIAVGENTFTCYEGGKIKIIFNSDVFKKVYERHSKNTQDSYMKPEFQYNLCKMTRKKTTKEGETQYPHYYTLKKENSQDPLMQGVRMTEHGKFLIFTKETEKFVPYSEEYLACIEPNYWGTAFEIYDSGLDEATLAKIPKFIAKPRRLLSKVVYDTNIMGDKPRFFSVFFWNFLENKEDMLKNVKPEYDTKRECYTLNFYGRAKLASARNFHLIYLDDPDSIILMHGKDNRNEFNLVYRHPLNMVQSFAISLISVGKKFCVA